MSKYDAYRALVDSHGLRVTDEFKFANIREEHSRLTKEPQPLLGFQMFLNLFEATSSVVPSWWDADKRQECERLSMDEAEWSSLQVEVTQEGVNGHYRDFLTAMQLRLFADVLEGWNPSGSPGRAVDVARTVASQYGH